MGSKLINETNLTATANAIRSKLGTQSTYTPAQFASAISSIPSGGGSGSEVISVCYGGWCGNNVYDTTLSISGLDSIPYPQELYAVAMVPYTQFFYEVMPFNMQTWPTEFNGECYMEGEVYELRGDIDCTYSNGTAVFSVVSSDPIDFLLFLWRNE